MRATDALIQHMTGLTPEQQQASIERWAAGVGVYEGTNIVLNGITAIVPVPQSVWDYIAIEPLDRAISVSASQIGQQRLSIEIGVRTDPQLDCSIRKLETIIESIVQDLLDNRVLGDSTLGMSAISVNYQVGIDDVKKPFARYANIEVTYKIPRNL